MKRTAQLLIGILISAFFLYLIVPGLHLPEVWRAMGQANYWWIVPGVAVYFVGLWARTWRWHFMLRHLKPVALARLFPVVCIGYFGNNIYPFRAGEVMRAYVLRQREEIPITSSLATVIIERIFDGLVMLLFVFLALPFAPIPAAFQRFVLFVTPLLLITTAVFIWLTVRPRWVAALYGWVAGHLLPARIRIRTDDIYERFMEGIASLRSGSDVLMIFVTSIVIWLMETVKYWFVMHAFTFSLFTPLSSRGAFHTFLALMLINGLVNLATTLPSAPGYIGTFDTPAIETLVAYGVDAQLAASYTLTLHVALWAPVTVLGAYYFWREQLRWSDFIAAQEQANQPAQSDAPVIE